MVRFKNRFIRRKIKKGQTINKDMLSLKGPAYGILPKFMDVVLGHKAKKDLPSDHPHLGRYNLMKYNDRSYREIKLRIRNIKKVSKQNKSIYDFKYCKN